MRKSEPRPPPPVFEPEENTEKWRVETKKQARNLEDSGPVIYFRLPIQGLVKPLKQKSGAVRRGIAICTCHRTTIGEGCSRHRAVLKTVCNDEDRICLVIAVVVVRITRRETSP